MNNKVLVWGTGKSAHTVADHIRREFDYCMKFMGFYVSNHQPIDMSEEEPVYELNQVLLSDVDLADTLVIPNPGKKIADILWEHRTIKNKRILFVSAENIRNPQKGEYFREINMSKPWLNGFEYHVADHCNLNCKGCGHCANLFGQPSFGDIDSYEKDLRRLADLFDGVGLIRLLGGEPLLNMDLIRFIEVTRKYFADAEIHIVTNGILIPSKGKQFLEYLKENCIILDISVYPPVEKELPRIIDILTSKEVEYHIMPVEQFYKRFSLQGKFNIYDAFRNCGTATCHTLYNGKIAPCIVPFSTEKINQEFDLNIPIDGWIDLHQEQICGEEINMLLKQPIGLCSHCNPEKHFFDWEQKRYADCKLEDWICN